MCQLNTITIVDATKTDAKVLASMWQSIDRCAIDQPFGGLTSTSESRALEIIHHAINSTKASVLVAHLGQSIVGTITGHIYQRPTVRLSSVGVIYSLWVELGHRQQGIGQALLDTIEQRLISKGAQAFQVGWDTSNSIASQWWQR